VVVVVRDGARQVGQVPRRLMDRRPHMAELVHEVAERAVE
jgi:hypothetical protein